jgi:RimJ/RimL family protein N-acetyltransferase
MTDPLIRPATSDDAADLIAYIQELTAEPGIQLLTGAGEFNKTVDEEMRYIQEMSDGGNSAIFLAYSGDQLVGEINLRGGSRRAERHSAVLGISVRRAWRGMGLGSRLLGTAMEWARAQSPLKRIELHVIAENQPAIHLYGKFGFEVEGRRKRSIYLGGRYLDDLIMAVWLEGR